MNLKERIKQILEIADNAKLLKALPLKEPAEHEDGVECYLCCGEGNVETEIAEFKTEYESISAGIQCFGYGDQLTASMRLVESMPMMLEIIKKQQEIIKYVKHNIFCDSSTYLLDKINQMEKEND